MSDIRIGISGWRYAPWRGEFYPAGLPQQSELAFASRAFSSIEINGSFYALQRPASYAHWFDETPDEFVFSVKAPRYITHILRLRDVEIPIANFFASGVFNLKQKLGPILWQFPPSLKFQAELFEKFLSQLPHDTEQAQALARKRDAHMAGRTRLAIDARRPLRHAVEIRNASFVNAEFTDMLRHYRVALVVADTAGKWPCCEDVTNDFLYLRLHGDEELYASGYTQAAIERWGDRIDAWSHGSQPEDAHLIEASKPSRQSRDVFCYFDNDMKVKAPFDAASLARYLRLPSPLLDASRPLLKTAQELGLKSTEPNETEFSEPEARGQRRRKTSSRSTRRAPTETKRAQNRSRARAPSDFPPAPPAH